MSGSEAVRIEGLSAGYGRIEVLTGLSLAVPVGATTALLGRNGAGKSTLFRVLAGLLPRRAGHVSVLGLDPKRRARAVKAAIGFVPEALDLHPRWRIREAVGLARALRGRAWDRGEEERLLGLFELSGRDRVGALSKGMRAKLALLLALGHRPRLVLLDEPASGLDPVVRREVLGSLVDAMGREGRTILLATHRMEDVERLADRVAFLAGGRIVREGPLDEVRPRGGNLEGAFLELLGAEGQEEEVLRCGA